MAVILLLARLTGVWNMKHNEKKIILESYGFEVGNRNPQLNTKYPGKFMVSEPYESSELPTKDGRNGPWCIVSDDLNALIDEGYDFLMTMRG